MNELERQTLFRRLKAFRRIFTRFDRLDVLLLGFIHLTLIVGALRYREHALDPKGNASSLAFETGSGVSCTHREC